MIDCCRNHHEGVAGACFSADRTSRYLLWRNWNAARPVMAALLLNPSIADETALDPTLTRVYRYANAWGFGGLRVLNAFALISTDPNGMRDRDLRDPVNDEHIRSIIRDPRVFRIMVGWGSNMQKPHLSYRRDEINAILATSRTPVYAWRLTKSGDPTHPLYLPSDIDPIRYDVEIVA